jgi:hypothetical protein
VFLISGSIGLFYTNTNLAAWTSLWVFGNLTFGTFALVGVLILVFMAFYNVEFDR